MSHLVQSNPKNMDFSDFDADPQGIGNVGAPFWAPKSEKRHHHKLQKKNENFCYLSFLLKMHQF